MTLGFNLSACIACPPETWPWRYVWILSCSSVSSRWSLPGPKFSFFTLSWHVLPLGSPNPHESGGCSVSSTPSPNLCDCSSFPTSWEGEGDFITLLKLPQCLSGRVLRSNLPSSPGLSTPHYSHAKAGNRWLVLSASVSPLSSHSDYGLRVLLDLAKALEVVPCIPPLDALDTDILEHPPVVRTETTY